MIQGQAGMKDLTPIQMDELQKRIYTLRGVQVMLDQQLAELYGVETRVLNQAVKRNMDRFPVEFLFQLAESDMEKLRSQIATLNDDSLRSQSVTLKKGRGQHRKYLPLELKQNQSAQKVERVLNALEEKSTLPKQGIFYDGTLSLFAKSKPKVSITICTKTISNKLEHDVKKWFAFSKLHINSVDILDKLKKEGVV